MLIYRKSRFDLEFFCISNQTILCRCLHIDLPDLDAVLRPLKGFTKIPRVYDANPPDEQLYESLAPSIRLFLSQAKLSRVPREVFNLQDVTVLSLRNNDLVELPPQIDRLTNLVELNVSSNMLRWLPFGILKLKKLQKLSVLPNPLHLWSGSSKEILRGAMEETVEWARAENLSVPSPGYTFLLPLQLRAISQVAFLAIDGSGSSYSTNTQNAHLSVIESWETYIPLAPTSGNNSKCQSLLEYALKTCSQASQFTQLPDLLGPNGPPAVLRMLQYAKDTGSQCCTICGRQFIVPRTEWIEWWIVDPIPYFPIPLIRRGCTWSCIPSRMIID